MIRKLTNLVTLMLLVPVLPIMGALRVKDAGTSATKWSENAGRSAESYATGAMAGAEDWARNTQQAADTFMQAVSAPGVKERFRRGVSRAGASKYSRKIETVARDRYAPGVAAATTDYQQGVDPYLQTLAGLTLSQRKPRGDAANYRRVEEVGKALNSKRLAMLGGGGS